MYPGNQPICPANTNANVITPTQTMIHPYNPYFWTPTRARPRPSRKPETPSVEPVYFYEFTNSTAYLDVELPGVRREDITVEVTGQDLCISGKRFVIHRDTQEGRDHDEEMFTDADISFIYYLQMRLGRDADAEHIVTKAYDDGVLTLAIPIKGENVLRKISVQV